MRRISLVFFVFFLFSSLSAKVINVSDYGVSPNSFEDATEGVKKTIEKFTKNPGSTLVFPKSRYDFWPTYAEHREYYISNTSSESDCPSKIKNIGLLFEGVKHITIDGDGSLFMFHGKIITIALDHSENIIIKNVSIDFERPSMTEFTVKEIYPDRLIAAIHLDSKYAIIDDRIHFYGEGWGMNDHFFCIETDTVAYIQSKTLRKTGYGKVTGVKLLSEREAEFELEKELPTDIVQGDCIENITWTASLRVSDCRMEMTNTRGLLVTTPKKVVIENNYFYRTGMYAILIAADANSWYESGAVQDVLIRNNIFDGCTYNSYQNNNYTIAIEPENHERTPKH